MALTKRNVAVLSSGAVLAVLVVFARACASRTSGTETPTTAAAKEDPVEQAAPIKQAAPIEQAPVEQARPTEQAQPPAQAAAPIAPVSPPNASGTPTAGTTANAPPRAHAAKTPPQTERECKTCNGVWGVHGLSPKPSCNCRTSDGGKRCRDGNDCEGLCTMGENPQREVTDPGPPARGFFVGKCSTLVNVFGCYRPIDDGAGVKAVDLTEAPQMICAD